MRIKNFGNLGLKQRLLLGTILSTTTGFAALIVTASWNISSAMNAASERSLEEKYTSVSATLYSQGESLLGYAYDISVSPDVIAAIQKKDRPALQALFAGHFKSLHEINTAVNSVEVGDAGGIILVRGHNPEKFGDDKSKTELFSEALKSQKPQFGMEVSPTSGKLSIDSVYPVFYGGQLIGLIKVGTYPQKEALMKIRSQIGAELAVIDTKTGKSYGSTFDGVEAQLAALSSRTQNIATKEGDYIAKRLPLLFGKRPVAGADIVLASNMTLASSILHLLIFTGLAALLLIVVATYFLLQQSLKQVVLITSRLSRTGETIYAVARNVFTAGHSLTENVSKQAEALQETSAAVEEIVATVRRNADNAAKARELSCSSSQTAKYGKSTVIEAIQAIEDIGKSHSEIAREMENNARDMKNIQEVITGIGEKTKVINDIVFQTKLLSFNASVEAARAGESGKGFAVVAEEVGNLAQMSGTAAREISDLLAQSILKVDEIANNTHRKADQMIHEGKERADQGIEVAKKCEATLDQVVESAESMDQMVQDIAQASDEQAKGIAEISKAVIALETANRQNSVAAEQNAAVSRKLSSEADAQRSAVDELILLFQGRTSSSAEHANGDSARAPAPVEDEPTSDRKAA